MLQAHSMDERARAILRANDRGGYTVPTDGLYPYQWNWDSAFAAFGFAEFDTNRAWTEFETLLSGQWANGMVPHIIFHKKAEGYFPGPDVWGTDANPPSSGMSQPPVAATFARAVFEKDPQLGRQRLAPLFPKFMAWHRWFRQNRCESGAVAIIHPWESGRDNAPEWDEAIASIDTSGVGEYTRRDTSHVDPEMRPTKADYDAYLAIVNFGSACGWNEDAFRKYGPFRMADPTMTFTLLRANRDLKALADELGEDASEINGWITGLEAGVQTLWNEEQGHYDARDLRRGTLCNSLSNASFLCWYAGINDDRMLIPLRKINSAAKYSVPSHPPESAFFNPRRYWRGPVWANPLDGTPAGGGNFTWTAAVWLAWASPNANGGK